MVLGCAVELHNIDFDSMYFLYIVLYTGSFYANTIWIYMQMTQDEIIKMARDSGIELYGLGKDRAKFVHRLEAFAKLVAQHEREACALICEELKYDGYEMVKDNPVLARKIRARGQA